MTSSTPSHNLQALQHHVLIPTSTGGLHGSKAEPHNCTTDKNPRAYRPSPNYPASGNGYISQSYRKPFSWHYSKWNKRQQSDQKPSSLSNSFIHTSEETALRCFTLTNRCTLSVSVMYCKISITQTGGHSRCYLNKTRKTGKCPSSHTFTTIPMTRKKHAIKARAGERTGWQEPLRNNKLQTL